MFVSSSTHSGRLLLATWGVWALCGLGLAQVETVDMMNLSHVAFVPNDAMLTDKVNDIAAWHDDDFGDSYLLVGCENGTALFKMAPDGMPLYMGKMATATVASLWRDIKVIHDHAFVVSEAPMHGTQILDLTALRAWEPVTGPQDWFPDANLPGPSVAHNAVSFEEESLLILVGSDWFGGGAAIFDVQNPETPQLLGGASEWGYIHDAQAVLYNGPDQEHAGKFVLFTAGPSGFNILDISDPTDVTLIGSASYDTPHYGHQVWVAETQDHAFFGDELDELNEGGPTRTVVFDLTDLDAPNVAEMFEASVDATDHNQYNHGEWLFQSNYNAGVRMLSDAWPSVPVLAERGHFDPVDDANAPGFEGAWSHVLLPQLGVLAFTSIEQGLWVVEPQFASLSEVTLVPPCTADSFDTSWEMTLDLIPGWAFPVTVEVEGVVLAPDSPTQWEVDEAGATSITFQGEGIDGVSPRLHLQSQRSNWSLDILGNVEGWTGTYVDLDGDGFGNPNQPVWGCEAEPGVSLSPSDCQDWNANTFPSALELCDGWDNDCDGMLDEGTSQLPWYIDADGDGFGTDQQPVVWSCIPLLGRVLIDGDCNDNEPDMFPGAPSTTQGVDNDCSGGIEPVELSECPGDFNGDGLRNTSDLLIMLSNFGCEAGCLTSMDSSDDVDIQDLLLWLTVLGSPCDF